MVRYLYHSGNYYLTAIETIKGYKNFMTNDLLPFFDDIIVDLVDNKDVYDFSVMFMTVFKKWYDIKFSKENF